MVGKPRTLSNEMCRMRPTCIIFSTNITVFLQAAGLIPGSIGNLDLVGDEPAILNLQESGTASSKPAGFELTDCTGFICLVQGTRTA